MKQYLELIESVTEGQEADFIRVDVTDYSQADYDQQVQNLRDQATQYAHYMIRKHHCNHDTSQSCTTELLEMKLQKLKALSESYNNDNSQGVSLD